MYRKLLPKHKSMMDGKWNGNTKQNIIICYFYQSVMWPFFIAEYVILKNSFASLQLWGSYSWSAGCESVSVFVQVCDCISPGTDLHERMQWKPFIFNAGNKGRGCFVSSLKYSGIWLFKSICKHIFQGTESPKPFTNKVLPCLLIAWGGDKMWGWSNMIWKKSLLMKNHLHDSFLVCLIFICGLCFPLTNTYLSHSFLF